MDTTLINFTIPKPLLISLDKQAKKEFRTRSEAIRDAVRMYLMRANALSDLTLFGQQQANKLGVTEDQVESIVDSIRTDAK